MYKYANTEEMANKYIDKIRSVSGKGSTGLTLKDALFNPQYRTATWVSMGYIVFHELTGVNVINLYSHNIFESMSGSGGLTVNQGVQLVGVACLVASSMATLTVRYFGRRTLLIFGHIAIAIVHSMVAIFNIEGNNVGVVCMIILFSFAY